MEAQIDKLGKVSITVDKDYWSINKSYNKLVIVELEGASTTYLSRKPVPSGVSIYNREYWIKFSKFSENQYEVVQTFGDNPEVTISQKSLTESRDNLQNQINEVTNEVSQLENNAPDEEDLTSVKVDDINVLKFKDKVHNPLTYSGLGKVYLRKNIAVSGFQFNGIVNNVTTELSSLGFIPEGVYYDIVQKIFVAKHNNKYYPAWDKNYGVMYYTPSAGRCFYYYDDTDTLRYYQWTDDGLESTDIVYNNILTQEMLSEDNTIYIAQYDYNLDERTITIPDNCIIKIEGGKFTNGKIISNGVIFKYDRPKSEVFEDIVFIDEIEEEKKPANLELSVDGQRALQDKEGKLEVVSLADRTVSAVDFRSTGKKFLQKNVQTVGGVEKNILTQAMMSTPNTIYTIILDYDLNGQTITIPEGCTLEFDGGSLSNGTVIGNRTKIKAGIVELYKNISINGSWNVDEAYPEWFGAKGDGITDDSISLQKCVDAFVITHLQDKSYAISTTLFLPNGRKIIGKGASKTTILCIENIENIISHTDETARDITLDSFLVCPNINNTCTNGIFLNKATSTRIINVTCGRCTNGFALNSFYVGAMRGCTATNCTTGFYFGINGGNSTSIHFLNNYALNCNTGYIFRNCTYINPISPSADSCDVAYESITSTITLNTPGCEDCTTFFKLVRHSDDLNVENFNSNSVHIINACVIAVHENTSGIIYISTSYRGDGPDKNHIVIDGLRMSFKVPTAQHKIITKVGDTILRVNDILLGSSKEIIYKDIINTYIDGCGWVRNNLSYWSDKSIGTTIYNELIGKFIKWNGTKWVDEKGYTAAINRGTTTQRPTDTLTISDAGYEYFDTTLGLPIYLKVTGSTKSWIKADGTDADA